MGDRKRRISASIIAIGIAAVFVAIPAAGQIRSHWVATWTATLEGSPPQTGSASPLATVRHQTVRIPVKISVGGPRLRLKLSNEYGSKPLMIGAASVATANGDATTRPFRSVPDGIAISKANSDWTVKGDTFAKVTFDGASHVAIPRGANILSDPIEFKTTPLQELAVSLYLPDETVLATYHNEQAGGSSPRSVIAPGAIISKDGDYTAMATMPIAAPSGDQHIYPPFLAAIDVVGSESTPVVVILGDTWSEGPGFWSSFLRDRLAPEGIAVANMGQVAGTLVFDRPGSLTGITRFDRDVLGTAGATHLFLFLGANDIIMPRPERNNVLPAATIAFAMKQIIDRGHAAGLKVVGATILPFEGVSQTVRPGLVSPEKGRLRDEVNAWMRNNRGLFDGLVDFDTLLRDPQRPARLLPAYDSGNHFTPNHAGSRKLADAIDVELFKK